MKKQCHILVSGLVQGVGFRFTARALAARYKVKGWVRNTRGGGVELEVAGPAADVDRFLQSLQEEFKNNITAFKMEESSAPAERQGFQIRF